MPTYLIINRKNLTDRVLNTFDADNNTDSKAKLPQHIPSQYNNIKEDIKCERADIDALRYYPRMARPQIGFSSYLSSLSYGPLFKVEENAQPPLPHDAASLSSSMNQLTVLVRNLEEIFRSVEPSHSNMNVYGHLIRNTLLLAAMEFENECKGVLNAHKYRPKNISKSGEERWTTGDFVNVLGPLRLEDYEVDLAFYPALASRKPFQGWNAQQPTQSLTWYNSYNAVKRNREHKFHQATLEAAIDAVTACAIMLAAQYRVILSWKDQIGGFFNFKQSPQWPLTQRYVFRPDAGEWEAIQYQFPKVDAN